MPQTVASPTPSESKIQAELVRWARAHPDPRCRLLFHIPNGGQRGGLSGGLMVAQGARAGVPDLFLPVPVTIQMSGRARVVSGLWIEMKKPGGVLSEQQKRWLSELARQGYAVAVCWSVADAQMVLSDYLAGHTAIAVHTTKALAMCPALDVAA